MFYSSQPSYGKLNLLVTKLQEYLSHVADEQDEDVPSLPQHVNGKVQPGIL